MAKKKRTDMESAEQQEEKHKVRERRLSKTLRVPLTDEELLKLGGELSAGIDTLNQIEADKKSVVEDFKARASVTQANVNRLSGLVRNRYDYRPVECVERMDYTARKLEIVRLDTGEIIETRRLLPEECQMELAAEENSEQDDEAAA